MRGTIVQKLTEILLMRSTQSRESPLAFFSDKIESMGILKRITTIGFIFVGLSSNAHAGWSWNIGYHNPPGSLLGVNFMHLWTNWAVELGIGNIQTSNNNSSTSNSSSSSLTVGGDVNLKYLFGSGTFRPFLEGGVGLGTWAGTGSNGGLAAGTGGGFFGGGFFLKGNPFYFYLGYLVFGGGGGDFNLGLGFDF